MARDYHSPGGQSYALVSPRVVRKIEATGGSK